jgi:hypothetical protein
VPIFVPINLAIFRVFGVKKGRFWGGFWGVFGGCFGPPKTPPRTHPGGPSRPGVPQDCKTGSRNDPRRESNSLTRPVTASAMTVEVSPSSAAIQHRAWSFTHTFRKMCGRVGASLSSNPRSKTRTGYPAKSILGYRTLSPRF